MARFTIRVIDPWTGKVHEEPNTVHLTTDDPRQAAAEIAALYAGPHLRVQVWAGAGADTTLTPDAEARPSA